MKIVLDCWETQQETVHPDTIFSHRKVFFFLGSMSVLWSIFSALGISGHSVPCFVCFFKKRKQIYVDLTCKFGSVNQKHSHERIRICPLCI